MKFRAVQRAVRVQRFDRSIGDAPSLGRVARMQGTGLPKGERRRKRRGESGRGDRERSKRRLVLLTWSAVLLLIALGTLGTALVLWLRPNMRHDAATGGESAVKERVVSRFESPSEEEALNLVKGAFAVRDPQMVSEFFRLGDTSPEAVVEFLGKIETVDGTIDGYSWLSSMDANGLLIEGVLVRTQDSGSFHNRLALLTPDETGKWKVDFEAFARVVRPSWDDLLGKAAGEGLIRVIVAADSYYNGPFHDESQWVCFGMVSPDTEMVMLGYCRKKSPQAKAMARILENKGIEPTMGARSGTRQPKRATLTVRRAEGADSRQFEILRVMAEDWVVGDKPFDGNFQ